MRIAATILLAATLCLVGLNCQAQSPNHTLDFAAPGTFSVAMADPQAATQPAQGIVGDWTGALDVQGQKLRLVLHVKKSADTLAATLDSPDQGANDIPISSVTVSGEDVKV